MKFTGTKNYVSTEDLSMAVNATIALERPLIIKGEPGTGKTLLAIEVAESLGMELICLLYTSPSPRDAHESRMPSSA